MGVSVCTSVCLSVCDVSIPLSRISCHHSGGSVVVVVVVGGGGRRFNSHEPAFSGTLTSHPTPLQEFLGLPRCYIYMRVCMCVCVYPKLHMPHYSFLNSVVSNPIYMHAFFLRIPILGGYVLF